MGRTAAVPTGSVRLTEAEVAWLAGDDSQENVRVIARSVATALLCLYRNALEREPEMYDRGLVVHLAQSLPMNGIRTTGRAARALAENALRTAVAAGYIERLWNEENGVWRYRLSELGATVSDAAWGEQGRAYLQAKATATVAEKREAELAELADALIPPTIEEDATAASE